VFGMINWTFTWLKPGGRLSYADFAEIVIELLAGGLPGAAAAAAAGQAGASAQGEGRLALAAAGKPPAGH